MLGWLIAATPPSMVEASAMKMMIWRQASVAGPIASITTRTSRATAATLGALAKKAATGVGARSEEHTSELQSLMRISYAVFCLKKNNTKTTNRTTRSIQHT